MASDGAMSVQGGGGDSPRPLEGGKKSPGPLPGGNKSAGPVGDSKESRDGRTGRSNGRDRSSSRDRSSRSRDERSGSRGHSRSRDSRSGSQDRSKRNGRNGNHGRNDNNHRNGRNDGGPRKNGPRGLRRDNIKSTYNHQETTNDPDEIRQQVEFYFSTSNLVQDKFLFTQIGGIENKPIDLKVITSFRRMQRFVPYSDIVKALQASEKLVITNTDKPGQEQIRRKEALDIGTELKLEDIKLNYETEAMKRTVYAKGFGEENSTTQLDIESFFRPYGIQSVRLRRTPFAVFKGSVFVEFESEDLAKQFLELETKPQWQEGKDLIIKSKAEYCKEKEDLINAGKLRPNSGYSQRKERGGGGKQRGGHKGRDSGGHRDGRKGRDSGGRGDDRSKRGGNNNKGRAPVSADALAKDDWKAKARAERQQEYEDNGIPKVMSTHDKMDVDQVDGKKVAKEAGDEKVAEKAAEKVDEEKATTKVDDNKGTKTAGDEDAKPAEKSQETVDAKTMEATKKRTHNAVDADDDADESQAKKPKAG